MKSINKTEKVGISNIALINFENDFLLNEKILKFFFKKLLDNKKDHLLKFFTKFHMKYYQKLNLTSDEFDINDNEKINDFRFFSFFLIEFNLEVLDLTGNSIGLINKMDFEYFCNGISKNKSIKNFNLSKNYLGNNPDLFQIFVESIINNKTLEILKLNENKLSKSEKNFENLNFIIEKNSKIKILELFDNGKSIETILTEFVKKIENKIIRF